jgi:hypothetical protein
LRVRPPVGGASNDFLHGQAQDPGVAPNESDERPILPAGPRRTALNAFLAAFLAVQLLVPLWGFLRPSADTTGSFSWNMYSQRYQVDARYVLLTPEGKGELLDPHDFMNRPDRWTSVMHRETLPAFHRWLCEELARRGRRGQVKAKVRVSANGEPWQDLVVPPNSTVCETGP